MHHLMSETFSDFSKIGVPGTMPHFKGQQDLHPPIRGIQRCNLL